MSPMEMKTTTVTGKNEEISRNVQEESVAAILTISFSLQTLSTIR